MLDALLNALKDTVFKVLALYGALFIWSFFVFRVSWWMTDGIHPLALVALLIGTFVIGHFIFKEAE